jgi:hypothetical protein
MALPSLGNICSRYAKQAPLMAVHDGAALVVSPALLRDGGLAETI